MRLNRRVTTQPVLTHEGGKAQRLESPLDELKRTVATCLLWENTFYEKGSDIAARISALCAKVAPAEISQLAMHARSDLKLRHVPLFLCLQLAHLYRGPIVSGTIAAVVQRPDEMGELLAMYRQDTRRPLSAQLKKGLARAFPKFTAYQLAKWNRDTAAYKLRDVMFLTHPKPKDKVQAEIWNKLVKGTLPPAETWEKRMSGGEKPVDVWTDMLTLKPGRQFRDLGYIALLMNLRNMQEAGVDPVLVGHAIYDGAPTSKALPLRFWNAAKAAPLYRDVLSQALQSVALGTMDGNTAVVIDVSGSMLDPISAKSTLKRWEAAALLALLVQSVCKATAVFTFGTRADMIGLKYRGFELLDHIQANGVHGGTHLKASLAQISRVGSIFDRVIVITDEQSQDGIYPTWAPKSYLINVASYKPVLDTTTGWKRIAGWSERVIDWIMLEEGGAFGITDDEDSE